MSSFLDLTLVIQSLHFLCAYWILSKFFLKPAYHHIMFLSQEKKRLLAAMQAQEEMLATERQEKYHHLSCLQQELKASFVSKEKNMMPPESPAKKVEATQLSPAESQKIVHEVVQQLTQRIADE